VTLEPVPSGTHAFLCSNIGSFEASVCHLCIEDPNPLVSGRGAEILRKAGAAVHLLSERLEISEADRNALVLEAEELAEVFLHNQRKNEPFLAVKSLAP